MLKQDLAAGHARDIAIHAADTRLASPVSLVPAAVLIAITDRPDPGVILTRRASHLRNIGVEYNINYSDERLDQCIKALMDMAYNTEQGADIPGAAGRHNAQGRERQHGHPAARALWPAGDEVPHDTGGMLTKRDCKAHGCFRSGRILPQLFDPQL